MASPSTKTSNFSQKDQISYKLVQKLLDERKFGKAAKLVESLVKKHPECIELLCLKCLVFRNLRERKGAALEAVKLALKLDIKSSTAWHAMGSYHRMENDYVQALNSYKQAARCDPSSPQILRDLSFLQLYTRQYSNFLDTRKSMLSYRSDSKLNWCVIPLALHLDGRPLEAAEFLLDWWSFPSEVVGSTTPRWETELRLYLVVLFEAAGQLQRALDHASTALEFCGQDLKDRTSALVLRGRLELRLGKWEAARQTFKSLIQALPENTDYLFGYFWSFPEFHACWPPFSCPPSAEPTDEDWVRPNIFTPQHEAHTMWLSQPLVQLVKSPFVDQWGRSLVLEACGRKRQTRWNRAAFWQVAYECVALTAQGGPQPSETRLCQVFDELQAELGRETDATVAFPLCFLQDEHLFRMRVARLLRRRLTKVSAAFFAIATNLLNCPATKREAVRGAVNDLRAELEQANCNPLQLAMLDALETITQVVFERRPAPEALSRLRHLVADQPTFFAIADILFELLQSLTLADEAALLMTQLYEMDTSERYLNDKAVAALLKVGKVKQAVATARSFNKPHPTREKLEPLDAQHTAQELAFAEAFEGMGNFAESARLLELIRGRYDNMEQESQDFYFYCMRRGNFRGLLNHLALNRKLKQHQTHMRAAVKLVDLYLRKHDNLLTPAPALSAAELGELRLETAGGVREECFDFEQVRNPLERASQVLSATLPDCGPGNFQFNQRCYLVHSYRCPPGVHRPFRNVQALSRLWLLSSRQRLHPKLFPSLLHFLFTRAHAESPTEPALQTLESRLLDDMGFEEVDSKACNAFLREAWQLHMMQSVCLRQRLCVFRALALCLTSEFRHRGSTGPLGGFVKLWNAGWKLLAVDAALVVDHLEEALAAVVGVRRRLLHEIRAVAAANLAGAMQEGVAAGVLDFVVNSAFLARQVTVKNELDSVAAAALQLEPREQLGQVVDTLCGEYEHIASYGAKD